MTDADEIQATGQAMVARAKKMHDAVAGDDPRDIFLACAFLMSWTIFGQSKELRDHAIGTALTMLQDERIFRDIRLDS